MPNRDKTGPGGKGRPGKGLGPCSREKNNISSDSSDSPGGFNRKRRRNK